jgi:hypothetical protein
VVQSSRSVEGVQHFAGVGPPASTRVMQLDGIQSVAADLPALGPALVLLA